MAKRRIKMIYMYMYNIYVYLLYIYIYFMSLFILNNIYHYNIIYLHAYVDILSNKMVNLMLNYGNL